MKGMAEDSPERIKGEELTREFVAALYRVSGELGDDTDAALWKVLMGVEDSFEFFDVCYDLTRRMWT